MALGDRSAREWVGACVTLPEVVDGAGNSFEPELLLLLEVDGPIVAHALGEPEITMVDLLRRAMRRPLNGPPRRPSRVRFADAQLAADVRAAKLGAEIMVGPTPEIDEAVESFRAFMAERMHAKGNPETDGITEFFRATKSLYEVAPWHELTDADGLRIDIPGLEVNGGVLAVRGKTGSQRGLFLFLSLADFKAFLRTVEESHEGRPFSADPGLALLSLTFERGADAPEQMRRDIARHGWSVADAHAYPVAERQEVLKGRCTFPTDREMQILTACSRALAAFARAHGPKLDTPDFLATETFTDDAGLTVRITLPYEAGDDWWGLSAPNDAHARVVRMVSLYAAEHFGHAWAKEREVFRFFEQERDLGAPLLAFEVELQGRRVGEWFRDERAHSLGDEERAWLDAELAGWLSVWSVVETEPDHAIVLLNDLLTGKSFRVVAQETVGARPGDAILARVIEHEGTAVLSGMHTRILHTEIAYVIDRMRKRLRRVSAVPVERLRAPAIGAAMIRAWTEAIAIEDAMSMPRRR